MGIKAMLNRNKATKLYYSKLSDLYYCLLTIISPVLNTKARYKKVFGKELNLAQPETLNEKILWLKLNRYIKDPLVINCADKYQVREYVEKCGYGHILNELYNVYDSPEEILWDELPNRFVIKWNYGAGMNIICTDKSKMDRGEVFAQLRKWRKIKYWLPYSEMQYKYTPKRIICERYICGLNGRLPVDYKIYCFNGKPLYIGNFIERNIEAHTIVRGYFDTQWNHIPICKNEIDITKFPKPEHLEEMIEIAAKLSAPFPFVRVDLYEAECKVIFGELTFTPTGGMATYYTEAVEKKYGEFISID